MRLTPRLIAHTNEPPPPRPHCTHEAERESAALARRAGLFKAGSTLVNLQSAEVLENSSALQVVSELMRETDGFERVLGRRPTDFCSKLYESSECAIIQIRRDDVTYNIKRWDRLKPLSTEQVCCCDHLCTTLSLAVTRRRPEHVRTRLKLSQ